MRGVLGGVCLGLAAAGAAAGQEASLGIELNKLESFEGGCRSFFLFRNSGEAPLTAFTMGLAILDRDGIIDRLLTIDAAPLPAGRTTLKLFEIPDIACDGVGTLILHEISACDAAVADCFGIIELTSLAEAPLVK